MEVLITGLTIFVVLAIFVLAKWIESEINSIFRRMDEIAEGLMETINVVNSNSDAQKLTRQHTNENNVDIAFMKRIIELHGRALNISEPKKEWEALLQSLKGEE